MKKVLKRVEIVLLIISIFAFLNGLLILFFYSHVNSDNIITFSKLSFVPASSNYFSPNIKKGDLLEFSIEGENEREDAVSLEKYVRENL